MAGGRKNQLSPSPILPFQAKASVTGTPFLLLPLRATPHTLEGEPVSRLDEKLLRVRNTPDPKQMVTLILQTQKRAFGAHFYLLPAHLWLGRGGGETEEARKECPASQKLSLLPRSGTEEVVVAPAPPSPVPGAR